VSEFEILAGTIHQSPTAERISEGNAAPSVQRQAHTTAAAFELPPPRFLPRRYKPRNVGEWTGHLTFASDLIVALEPRLLVELGTHWGEAYFTFCQTVQEHGLSCLCYAVDHWMGDEHAGHYGEEVFEEVSGYNSRFYRQFSYLLRRSFDDALAQFGDDSIGLLHIDGLHTYEAVLHDFRNWLPKVAPGGIVLLHDICPRHQDFGVWRLWEEIKAEFPDTFEFHHSWGLGVLRKPGGHNTTPLSKLLFDSSPALQEDLRRHYVTYASHLEHVLGSLPAMTGAKVEAPSEIRVEVFPWVNGGYSPAVCQIRKMSAGKWNTLVFDFRETNIRGPLRIDPGCETSFIEMGDILIHSAETGDLLWSSPASPERPELLLAGTAIPHPEKPSFVVNVGEDPQVLLNTSAQVAGPLKLTVDLKVTPTGHAAAQMLRSTFSASLALERQKLAATQQQRDTLASQLDQATGELDKTKVQLGQASAALQATRELLVREESKCEQIQKSLSWKVTAPIRRLMTALRSGRPR